MTRYLPFGARTREEAERALADKVGVEMPICAAVAAILDGSVDVQTAVAGLLSRPRRSEA